MNVAVELSSEENSEFSDATGEEEMSDEIDSGIDNEQEEENAGDEGEAFFITSRVCSRGNVFVVCVCVCLGYNF